MNKTELKKALDGLGIKAGDIVLLHSALSSIGDVAGGANTVVNALLDVLGKTGTLVVPVFGDLGIITQVVRNHPQAVLSDCPKGTVAAIGAKAKQICQNHAQADTVHGAGSPYLKIAELGGYVMLLGVDQDRNTTMHSVEALLQLPYLSTVSGMIKCGKKQTEKTWQYYPGPHRDFIGLDKILRNSGKMTINNIGDAVARLIKSQDLIDLMLGQGSRNPAFCLCENPACADCVTQRAAIFRAELRQETFKLSVSSALAGKYIPEIIDNLNSVGIEYLELDYLQGHPAHLLPEAKLVAAVRELAESNIKISGMRLPAIPADLSAIVARLNAAGINRLIMPIDAAPGKLAKTVPPNLALSFYNAAISGKVATTAMQELNTEKISAGFTFNAASFASSGEKPFLGTYREGKFVKYLDQLDLADATFNGMPAKLARGNAEIKELISILRCRSFKGFMTLTATNRLAGSFNDAVSAFKQILNEI